MTQADAAQALERYLIDQTQPMPKGFATPEALADCVDLSIAHTPILLPRGFYPHKAVRLGNGKYAIYDVGYPRANMGNHAWSVDASEIRIHRARFLIQRDLFYQDLIQDSDNSLTWFRWWPGGYMHEPKWIIRERLVPHFVSSGTFIPDKKTNPMGQHAVKHYVYADGSIEVEAFR